MKTLRSSQEIEKTPRGGLSLLKFPRLGPETALLNVLSTREGGVSEAPFGSLNLSYKVGDHPSAVRENRELLCRAAGLDPRDLVSLRQVHSDKVVRVSGKDRGRGGEVPSQEGDALITNEAGLPLLILVADCMAVFLYDPVHKAIGLAHAGWRGTVSHIAVKTLLTMGEVFGTKPVEVRAALGPAIGGCCYEVDDAVRNEFSRVFPWAGEVFTDTFNGKYRLDIEEANARQLLEIGVPAGQLFRSGLCTVNNLDMFFSHRAEASDSHSTGRFGALMMLK